MRLHLARLFLACSMLTMARAEALLGSDYGDYDTQKYDDDASSYGVGLYNSHYYSPDGKKEDYYVDPVFVACLGALALVGYGMLDLTNRFNALNDDFNDVASDNNNFCTFFNTIANNADATDATVNSLVDSIRNSAQGVTCQTNRG